MKSDKQLLNEIAERTYMAITDIEVAAEAIKAIDLDSREPYEQRLEMQRMCAEIRGIRHYWLRLKDAMERNPLPSNQVDKPIWAKKQ